MVFNWLFWIAMWVVILLAIVNIEKFKDFKNQSNTRPIKILTKSSIYTCGVFCLVLCLAVGMFFVVDKVADKKQREWCRYDIDSYKEKGNLMEVNVISPEGDKCRVIGVPKNRCTISVDKSEKKKKKVEQPDIVDKELIVEEEQFSNPVVSLLYNQRVSRKDLGKLSDSAIEGLRPVLGNVKVYRIVSK